MRRFAMMKKTTEADLTCDRLRRLACWLAHVYIRLVMATTRWDRIGFEHPRRLLDQGKPFIVTFWHGRFHDDAVQLVSGHPFNMLISAHGDGVMIARTVAYFGIDTIAGSTSRGGLDAVKAMVVQTARWRNYRRYPDGPMARACGQPTAPSGLPVGPRPHPAVDCCGQKTKSHEHLGSIFGRPALFPRRDDLGRADRGSVDADDTIIAAFASIWKNDE